MTLNEQQQNILAFAKFYCNKGFSVIPVKKDKKAYVDWKDYQYRRATIDDIENWWRMLPDAQIAIVTGEISNISVIDIDVKNFDGDPETLWSFLPQDTLIAKTGSGGRHYFFNHMPGLRNKARIKPHIDIRAEGGYFIAAPSVSDFGSYEWINRAERIDFPVHLFPELTERKSEYTQSDRVSTRMTDLERIDVIKNFEGAGEGGRNDSITRLMGEIKWKFHGAAWDGEVLPILLEANQRNTPPLPEKEVRAIYESIKAIDIADPYSYHTSYLKERPVEIPSTEDDEKIILLSELAEIERPHSNKYFPLGIEPFDKALLGGLVPGDLMTIAAFPAHGKTTFAQTLAMNMLMSGHKVLFFSYEMMSHHIWDKFVRMGVEKDACLYSPLKIHGGIGWIEKIVRKSKAMYGTEIVVIDHLGYLQPKSKSGRREGNDSAILTGILQDIKMLAREQEIAVIMPVHLRKRVGNIKKNTFPTANEIQNTAGVNQESDVVLIMYREEDASKNATELYTGKTIIEVHKNRRGGGNPRRYFSMLKGDVLVIDLIKEDVPKSYHEPKEKEPDPQPELDFTPKEEPKAPMALITPDYEAADPKTFDYQNASLEDAAAMVALAMGKKD